MERDDASLEFTTLKAMTNCCLLCKYLYELWSIMFERVTINNSLGIGIIKVECVYVYRSLYNTLL